MLFHITYRTYAGTTEVGRVGVADSAVRSSAELRREAMTIARFKYPQARSITSAVQIGAGTRPAFGRRA